MSAAIHTRFSGPTPRNGGAIRAWTKDGKADTSLRLPYPHEMNHHSRHPFAAKALAEKLGWSGLWIVGHNEDGSVSCVQVPRTAAPTLIDAQRSRYSATYGLEGEDWFFVAGDTK